MTPIDRPAPQASYRGAALRGASLTGVGTAGKAFFQIAVIVVLARLLTPDDFGVMAMVFPIIAFAQVLQDAGLGWAVLQRGRISDAELSTIFWLNAALGVLLAAIFVLVSPLVADFYDEPRVRSLTAAAGGLLLLAALATQPMAILNRQLKFGALAIIDIASLAVGTSLAITVAYLTGSYWAIFLLSLGTSLTSCTLAWLFSKWRPGPRASMSSVIDLVRFGGHITLSNLTTYFSRNLDNILIGRVWGATPLGFYERAYKVVLMPILYVHMPLFRLLVPILSQTRELPERYRRLFLTSYQASLLMTVPGVLVLAVLTRPVVHLVMGDNWMAGAPIFTWLAWACLAQLLTGPLTMIFVSQGRSKDAMTSSIATGVYTSLAFLIGIRWGATGVAAAFAISEAIRTPVMLWFATRRGAVSFRDIVTAAAPFIIGGAAAALVLSQIIAHLPADRESGVAVVAAAIALSYAVVTPFLLATRDGRTTLGEILHYGKHVFTRRQKVAPDQI